MKKRKPYPYIYKQKYDPFYLKGGEREKGSKKYGWHHLFKEQKIFKFEWDYCGTCRKMFVRCPMCGNNSCNAGFGRVKDLYHAAAFGDKAAKECPVCNLAYEFQHMAQAADLVPKISKKEMRRKEKQTDDAMDKLFK